MALGVTPSRHRVLLVGPRVVQLRAQFEQRGYPVVAAAKGVEGMAHLDTDPCDLVMLELNLGDLTATEFLMAARQGHPRAAFLLLDDAARAGQIVKAMQAGLDGYMATPPEDERLFYEVERHLSRLEAEASDASEASGFEDRAVQTSMTTMAEVDAMQGDGPELALAKETIKSLQGDLVRFEADATRYQAVTNVLGGLLEAPLDTAEAMRLRERLGLAQVAEIELMTLRSDVQSLKQSKREQDARAEELLRELKVARAAAEDAIPIEDKGDSVRIAELEADLARAERRCKELETTLTAARGALSNAEDELEAAVLEAKASARGDVDAAAARAAELDEKCGLLDAEVARLSGVAERVVAERNDLKDAVAAERAEVARLQAALRAAEDAAASSSAKSAEDDIKRSAELEDAIGAAVDDAVAKERTAAAAAQQSAVDDAVAAERTRLEREHKSGLETAMSAATMAAGDKAKTALDKAIADERAAADGRLKDAVAKARADAAADAAAATNTDAAAKLQALRAELEAQLADAQAAAQAARERADDVELQLEEARTRTEFLEEDAARVVTDADERVKAAELAFKKEKVRLVEEKQAAASGSQEAVIKLDRFRDELAKAKKLADDTIANKDALEARVAAAEASRDEAERAARATQEAHAVDAERARAATSSLAAAETVVEGLRGRVEEFEAALASTRAQADADRDSAQRAGVRASEAERRATELEARVNDAVARLAGAERTLAEKADALLDAQARAVVDGDDRARAEAELAARGGRIAALERELIDAVDRAGAAETSLLAATDALTQEREATTMLQAAVREKAAEVEGLMARARDAESALTESAQAAITQARVDGDARAQATVDAANVELARVRTEAQAVHAQATQAVAELQGRLATTDAERQGLLAERGRMLEVIGRLESEVSSLRDQVTLTSQNGHDGRAAELGLRVAELEAQLARFDPATVATVRSLVDAVDPLRWGLGAAIDYLYPFEGNDQALASHVRNLRLLQATLARLVSESGKSNAAG